MSKTLNKKVKKLEEEEFKDLPLSVLHNYTETKLFDSYVDRDMKIEICRHIKKEIYLRIADHLTEKYKLHNNEA